MSILDYIDGRVFSPVFQNDIPLIKSERADAVARGLALATRNKEKIMVYGDYDMDGFSAAMVWKETFAVAGNSNLEFFRYGSRMHRLDPDIIRQTKESNCSVVLICDTGSSFEDQQILRLLEMSGCFVIVIDHHTYVGDYEEDAKSRLIFNSRCETIALADCEVSAAYASLLIAKIMCEKYLNCSLAFNAKVYALASMYADVVDVSSVLGRALYNAVAMTKAPGPKAFAELNNVSYMFSRRLFSYIISPKFNACFRTSNFEPLNALLSSKDDYSVKKAISAIKDIHSDTSRVTRGMVGMFERERIGDFVLCVHKITSETAWTGIRNFTGVIATKISQEEMAPTVVVVKDGRSYEGSVRDYYNRPLLSTFRLFCSADGHPSAFGLSFNDMAEFKQNLNAMRGVNLGESPVPYLTVSSGIIESQEDIDALALYNEYMNTNPPIMISHKISKVTLVRSSKWNKFYDVGMGSGMIVRTSRPLLEGSTIIIEPVICKGVELREME